MTMWQCDCGLMTIQLDTKPVLLAPCCLKPYRKIYSCKPAPIPRPEVET